jgi:hypothetical protein
MNYSEILFKNWCALSGWSCHKIPEEVMRTPDFKIGKNDFYVFAEVKEIVANEEEKESLALLDNKQCGVAYGELPGKTVRTKINSAYPQIKRLSKKSSCSGVLVLYNKTEMPGLGRINHYHVLTAMFGLQTIDFSVQHKSVIDVTESGESLGCKESVSPTRNTYLSAILSLYEHHEKGLIAFIYHNPYAIHPLKYDLCNAPQTIQYKLCNQINNWVLAEN